MVPRAGNQPVACLGKTRANVLGRPGQNSCPPGLDNPTTGPGVRPQHRNTTDSRSAFGCRNWIIGLTGLRIDPYTDPGGLAHTHQGGGKDRIGESVVCSCCGGCICCALGIRGQVYVFCNVMVSCRSAEQLVTSGGLGKPWA